MSPTTFLQHQILPYVRNLYIGCLQRFNTDEGPCDNYQKYFYQCNLYIHHYRFFLFRTTGDIYLLYNFISNAKQYWFSTWLLHNIIMHTCWCHHDHMVVGFICNQCLSPLTLWVRIPLRRGVLDTTLCDKVCQSHVAGQWFSQGTPVSFTNKTDRHNIKVALNTITLTLTLYIHVQHL
jgi:hypothetical protein